MHISIGNDKLGKIPSISLPPGKSCMPGIPCLKDCYALNISKRFPHVRRNWEENYNTYLYQKVEFYKFIYNFLMEEKPSFFRWHIGGDIPDAYYFEQMVSMAMCFPKIRFMAFTKRYDIVMGRPHPNNLNVILSMWPYLKKPETNLFRAWVIGDPRIPENTFSCYGKCEDCLKCFIKTNVQVDIALRGH